jgi:hypothetical protein
MELDTFIDDLLDRHNYFVNITKIVQEGVTSLEINYAKEEIEALVILYSEDKKICGIQYLSDFVLSEQEGAESELFYLPVCLVRIYIFMYLMKRIEEKELPYSAVRFFDESGNRLENLYTLLPEPELEEDKRKEKELDAILAQMIKNRKLLGQLDEKLREKGLFHMFYLLKGLLV